MIKSRNVIWLGIGLVLLGALILVVVFVAHPRRDLPVTATLTPSIEPSTVVTEVSPSPTANASVFPLTAQIGSVTPNASPNLPPAATFLVTSAPPASPNLPPAPTLLVTYSPPASPNFPPLPPQMRTGTPAP